MSIDWPLAESLEPVVVEVHTRGFPPAVHPAEADLFCRQAAMPGHNQAALEAAHIAVVGAGGLGSWIALGLARSGVRRLTIIDPDRYDRTNVPRQLAFPGDLGAPKAHALARNIAPHLTNAGVVRAIAASYSRDLTGELADVSVLIVSIDNNVGRLDASRWGVANQRPVVFAMLSMDGLRAQVFLQEPTGPCLNCMLPDLDPHSLAPCAAVSIASCYVAAGHALQAAVSVLSHGHVPAWRETSLDGSTERASRPSRRPGCWLCG